MLEEVTESEGYYDENGTYHYPDGTTVAPDEVGTGYDEYRGYYDENGTYHYPDGTTVPAEAAGTGYDEYGGYYDENGTYHHPDGTTTAPDATENPYDEYGGYYDENGTYHYPEGDGEGNGYYDEEGVYHTTSGTSQYTQSQSFATNSVTDVDPPPISMTVEGWANRELRYARSTMPASRWARAIVQAVDKDDYLTIADLLEGKHNFHLPPPIGDAVKADTTPKISERLKSSSSRVVTPHILSLINMQVSPTTGYGNYIWTPSIHRWSGDTILHMAARQNRLASTSLLLAMGASPTIANASGITAGNIILQNFGVSAENLRYDCRRLLLKITPSNQFDRLPATLLFTPHVMKEARSMFMNGRIHYTELPKALRDPSAEGVRTTSAMISHRNRMYLSFNKRFLDRIDKGESENINGDPAYEEDINFDAPYFRRLGLPRPSDMHVAKMEVPKFVAPLDANTPTISTSEKRTRGLLQRSLLDADESKRMLDTISVDSDYVADQASKKSDSRPQSGTGNPTSRPQTAFFNKKATHKAGSIMRATDVFSKNNVTDLASLITAQNHRHRIKLAAAAINRATGIPLMNAVVIGNELERLLQKEKDVSQLSIADLSMLDPRAFCSNSTLQFLSDAPHFKELANEALASSAHLVHNRSGGVVSSEDSANRTAHKMTPLEAKILANSSVPEKKFRVIDPRRDSSDSESELASQSSDDDSDISELKDKKIKRELARHKHALANDAIAAWAAARDLPHPDGNSDVQEEEADISLPPVTTISTTNNLKYTRLTKEEIIHLANALAAGDGFIAQITLARVRLTPMVVQPLILSLPACNALSYMDLSGNCLTDEVIDSLSSVVTHCKSLKRLTLAQNRLTHDGIVRLVTAIDSPNCNIDWCSVAHNRMRVEEYEVIAKLLEEREFDCSQIAKSSPPYTFKRSAGRSAHFPGGVIYETITTGRVNIQMYRALTLII